MPRASLVKSDDKDEEENNIPLTTSETDQKVYKMTEHMSNRVMYLLNDFFFLGI